MVSPMSSFTFALSLAKRESGEGGEGGRAMALWRCHQRRGTRGEHGRSDAIFSYCVVMGEEGQGESVEGLMPSLAIALTWAKRERRRAC